MNYNFNMAHVAKLIYPPLKRQVKRMALLAAMLFPLQVLRDYIFNVYRFDVERRARISPQKIVFEQALNYFFNISAEPRIQLITANTLFEPVWFYNQEEGYDSIWFFNEGEGQDPVWFFTGEEQGGNFDFIVRTPLSLQSKEVQLKALLDRYKVFGTTYQIQYY